MAKFALILPAAGRSSRFGDSGRKKVFIELAGRAVWLRAAEPFLAREDVHQVILAVAPGDREGVEARFGANLAFHGIRLVEGGAERADSIARALEVVDPACDHVAVHDAARPCVPAETIEAVFRACVEHGAALPGLPVTDTLKRVDPHGWIAETVPREGLVAVQTPQAFRRDLLVRAYEHRAAVGDAATDDARLVEATGHRCWVVEGSPLNIKITTPADLRLAEAILLARPEPKSEKPAHPFADERAMW